jgi:ATP-dependent DNA helicase RecG
MEEAGQPAPEYRQNEFMVYATIRQAKDVTTTKKTTEKTTEKILSLILENPNITTEELARVCDMTPDGVYYHTKRLRENGVLIREGGRKEGNWVVVKKS